MPLLGQLSIKGRALRLLGAREHSRAELERKLAAHEEEPGQLRQALDELQAKGFISAQRVVDSVLHRRAARLGAARIRQELQQKGLEPALVRDAVAGLQATELQRAQAVWHKKFGASPPADGPAERARQMRFLQYRGFSGEAIKQTLRQATQGADE